MVNKGKVEEKKYFIKAIQKSSSTSFGVTCAVKQMNCYRSVGCAYPMSVCSIMVHLSSAAKKYFLQSKARFPGLLERVYSFPLPGFIQMYTASSGPHPVDGGKKEEQLLDCRNHICTKYCRIKPLRNTWKVHERIKILQGSCGEFKMQHSSS